MPLSLHFYDLEEVCSALTYCCIEHRTLEACFWLQELIDSDEIELAIRVLVEVYVIRYGISALSWFNEAYRAIIKPVIDPADIVFLCISLCNIGQVDVSLMALSFVTTLDILQNKPPASAAAAEGKGESTEIEHYFTRALASQNIRGALWAASQCKPEFIVTITDQLASMLPPPLVLAYEAAKTLNEWSGLNYNPFASMTLCFMILCIKPEERASQFVQLNGTNEFYLQKLDQWNKVIGRRARRIYSIPRDSLYLTSWRGRIPHTQNTFSQIRKLGRSPELTYQILEGCSVWQKLMTACCCSSRSDYSYEEFCRHAFPDDIPDEWSLEEVMKSHGSGINNPGERFYWRRWLRRWLTSGDRKYYLMNASSVILKAIDQFEIDDLQHGWSIELQFDAIAQHILVSRSIAQAQVPHELINKIRKINI